MVNFTLKELQQFTAHEEEMVKEILSAKCPNDQEPDESSLNLLLAYSKALSVRKSDYLKNLNFVLN